MTHDFSEKPPWAAYVWTDDTAIWVQLPCPVGKAPVLVQYSRSEGGFAKAVTLIEQCANIKGKGPSPGWYRHSPAQLPQVPVKRSKKPSPLEGAPQALLDALKKVIP